MPSRAMGGGRGVGACLEALRAYAQVEKAVHPFDPGGHATGKPSLEVAAAFEVRIAPEWTPRLTPWAS